MGVISINLCRAVYLCGHCSSAPTLSSALTCTAIPNYSGFALMIPLPLGIVQTSLTLLSLTRGIPNS